MKLWRELTQEEERQFRQWARENYKPLSEINGLWHPVIQDECKKINENTSLKFLEKELQELTQDLKGDK